MKDPNAIIQNKHKQPKDFTGEEQGMDREIKQTKEGNGGVQRGMADKKKLRYCLITDKMQVADYK